MVSTQYMVCSTNSEPSRLVPFRASHCYSWLEATQVYDGPLFLAWWFCVDAFAAIIPTNEIGLAETCVCCFVLLPRPRTSNSLVGRSATRSMKQTTDAGIGEKWDADCSILSILGINRVQRLPNHAGRWVFPPPSTIKPIKLPTMNNETIDPTGTGTGTKGTKVKKGKRQSQRKREKVEKPRISLPPYRQHPTATIWSWFGDRWPNK